MIHYNKVNWKNLKIFFENIFPIDFQSPIDFSQLHMIRPQMSFCIQIKFFLRSFLQMIRKQFRDTCKIQTRQYKALKAQVLQSTSKEEQKTIIRKLKEEQRRKMALLGEQYEQTIADMLQKQSVCTNSYYALLILNRSVVDCC